MSEVEAASAVEIKAPRTRKPKDPAAPPRKRREVAAHIEAGAPTPQGTAPDKVYGWPVKDGFARIIIFSEPNDGNKIRYIETQLGDHPKVYLAKNKMHILPMGLVNNIIDTEQIMPVDDTSDPQHPRRYYEPKPRFPHSDPIPATAAEYVAYRQAQEKLPHPNSLAKK